jgi:1-phosphofructokinase
MIHCLGLNPSLDHTLEVPGLPAAGHVRARRRCLVPAGKATNLARVLGQLGTEARLCGFVGEEDAGRFRRRFAGLPVAVAQTALAAATRINTTLLDPQSGRELHLREAGEPVTGADLERCAAALRAALAPGDWLVVAGSLPPGAAPADVAALLVDLVGRGCRVAVDGSGDFLAALRQAPLALLTPNRRELGEFLGREVAGGEALCRAAREAVADPARAVEMLLVSDGAAGAGLFTPDGACWGQAPPAAVCNTVGAGDALLGGFLAAWTAGAGPEGALRGALGAAGSAVEAAGAGTIDPARAADLAARCSLRAVS